MDTLLLLPGFGYKTVGAMELSVANERFQPFIQRWRSTDYISMAQQLSPGGGGVSESAGDSKFMVDDTLLSDIMDLDPLSDQLGEGWMSNQGDFGLPYFSSSYSFTPSPAHSQGTPMYSHANGSLGVTSQQDSHQMLALDSQQASQAIPTSGCSLPLSSQGYAHPSLNPISAGSGNLSHMLLSDQVSGVSPSSILDEGGLLGENKDLSGFSHMDKSRDVRGEAADDERTTGNHHGSSLSNSDYCENETRGCEREKEKSGMTGEERTVRSGGFDIYGKKIRGLMRVPVGPSLSLRDRMMQALRFIGRLRMDVLAQAWMPVTQGNRTFLTTREQPYVLEHKNDQLWLYRSVSEKYDFPADKDSGAYAGLPGRVYLHQRPEWTPNVQFYTSQEYLRVKEAQRCDVRGSLAVPVLDPVTRQCVAVIELVMRAEKVQYGPEIDIICRALQVS